MAERPILFSGPMVKAILEGRKTQTRRIVKPPAWALPNPYLDQWGNSYWLHDDARPNEEHLYAKTWPRSKVGIGSNPGPCCPYGQPGDELWVRETWHQCPKKDKERYCYRADGCGMGADDWSPSIYMPRWASRLQLVIREVRVQRLQDISEEDAIAEGARHRFAGRNQYGQEREGWSFEDPHPIDANQQHGYGRCLGSARFAFGNGWNCLNAKRAPWLSNPFVWAITFERKV